MSHRITNSDLYAVLKRINAIANHGIQEPYQDGTNLANVGTYVLDWAYGGVRLSRMSNEAGGQVDVTRRGTKRETYWAMQNFLTGYAAACQGHPALNHHTTQG